MWEKFQFSSKFKLDDKIFNATHDSKITTFYEMALHLC